MAEIAWTTERGFIAVGSIVLAGGVFFAVRPNLKKTFAVGLCAIGAVGIVAGGIAGASAGKRDQLVKANEEDHFAHKECGEEKSDAKQDRGDEHALPAKLRQRSTHALIDGLTARIRHGHARPAGP